MCLEKVLSNIVSSAICQKRCAFFVEVDQMAVVAHGNSQDCSQSRLVPPPNS